MFVSVWLLVWNVHFINVHMQYSNGCAALISFQTHPITAHYFCMLWWCNYLVQNDGRDDNESNVYVTVCHIICASTPLSYQMCITVTLTDSSQGQQG